MGISFYFTLGKYKILARVLYRRSQNFKVPSIRKTSTSAKGRADASFSNKLIVCVQNCRGRS